MSERELTAHLRPELTSAAQIPVRLAEACCDRHRREGATTIALTVTTARSRVTMPEELIRVIGPRLGSVREPGGLSQVFPVGELLEHEGGDV